LPAPSLDLADAVKALSIGWALFILALCSIPGPSLPESTLFSFDKVGHLGMFFLGALLWLQTWPERPKRVVLAGLAFSVGTELYQGLMPFLGRSADPFDVVADVLGLLLGFALWQWGRRQFAPRAEQHV
jgi:VanZ family protein